MEETVVKSPVKNDSYMSNYLCGKALKPHIDKAVRKLRGYDFDTIVCRGVSGLLFASPLAMRLKKHLAVIRKKDERSHSWSIYDGYMGKKLLIVDDCICSGNTIDQILTEIVAAEKYSYVYSTSSKGFSAKVVAIYLYNDLVKYAGEQTYIKKHLSYSVPIISQRTIKHGDKIFGR